MSTALKQHGKRVAIVTGAAGGIGSAIVDRLLADGFAVAAVDINGDGLSELAERIGASDCFAAFEFDASESALQGVADIRDTLGEPYALVNAGALLHSGSAVTTTDEDWARILAADLTAPFKLCRAVLPGMIQRGAGVIVNIGSIGTEIGFRERVAYCAAKAGLVGMTRAMAVDHSKSGIRINAVNPGTTETPMVTSMFENAPDPVASRKLSESHQPSGRIGLPREIAAAVAFLVGDDSSYVYGATLTVDGGRSIW
jgi:NAD(P)-dependent dehydrogenase (short-subunit alcohol dehydrogenase family)